MKRYRRCQHHARAHWGQHQRPHIHDCRKIYRHDSTALTRCFILAQISTAGRPSYGQIYPARHRAGKIFPSRVCLTFVDAYPAGRRSFWHSVAVKASSKVATCHHKVSTVRSSGFRNKALSLAKTISMGFRSGLQGGKSSRCARTAAPLAGGSL